MSGDFQLTSHQYQIRALCTAGRTLAISLDEAQDGGELLPIFSLQE